MFQSSPSCLYSTRDNRLREGIHNPSNPSAVHPHKSSRPSMTTVITMYDEKYIPHQMEDDERKSGKFERNFEYSVGVMGAGMRLGDYCRES